MSKEVADNSSRRWEAGGRQGRRGPGRDPPKTATWERRRARLSGHDGLREFWTSYRDTFGEMKSEFRNVFADDAGHAALDGPPSDANGNDVSYDGVSLLEIEDGKVSRFRAYFDPRTVNEQVVD